MHREDALPDDEFEAANERASGAQLALCLGTSLQITPACNIPLRTVRAGGKLVIVNLQATPKDKKADLVIHARCEVRASRPPQLPVSLLSASTVLASVVEGSACSLCGCYCCITKRSCSVCSG